MKNKRFGYLLKIAIIFLAYFITARIGLKLNAVSGFATLVWAPSGIALAAMLILGYRYWPGVALAAFSINLLTGASPLVALGITLGNTLEALVGAYLLNRFAQFQQTLERLKDIYSLVLYAALFSTLISATIGVTTLLVDGTVSGSTYVSTWTAWWVGDMLGMLIIAPLILIWNKRRLTVLQSKRLSEALIYTTLLLGVNILVFRGSSWIGVKPFTLAYAIFPILIWVALRFGQIGSITAIFLTSLTAIWGTVVSFDSSTGSLSHRLLLLQSFIGISAVTFMTMAAVVAEREYTIKQKQKILQRAELLTRQRSRLVVLNQIKDEFIALASHQLRTPATSVKQYLGILLENYAGSLTEAQRKMLMTANESNERQLHIIDSILRVAQVDAGNTILKKEPVDLTLLVKETIDGQTSVFANRNQVVTFAPKSTSLVATIDKEKIRMVLENILDNASKYSPPGKSLEVSLRKIKKTVAISVKDDGVGILKKDLNKLFRKFSRIDSPLSISVGGTGVGLYWAKKIVALHHGSIMVTSVPNKGSTFTITLPAGK